MLAFQTLTADIFGEAYLSSGLLDIWGNTPASQCTGAQDYGCFRQGTGTNYINPVQSARIRTAETFSFRYGKVEVEAKMPKGDWLWPGTFYQIVFYRLSHRNIAINSILLSIILLYLMILHRIHVDMDIIRYHTRNYFIERIHSIVKHTSCFAYQCIAYFNIISLSMLCGK